MKAIYQIGTTIGLVLGLMFPSIGYSREPTRSNSRDFNNDGIVDAIDRFYDTNNDGIEDIFEQTRYDENGVRRLTDRLCDTNYDGTKDFFEQTQYDENGVRRLILSDDNRDGVINITITLDGEGNIIHMSNYHQ